MAGLFAAEIKGTPTNKRDTHLLRQKQPERLSSAQEPRKPAMTRPRSALISLLDTAWYHGNWGVGFQLMSAASVDCAALPFSDGNDHDDQLGIANFANIRIDELLPHRWQPPG